MEKKVTKAMERAIAKVEKAYHACKYKFSEYEYFNDKGNENARYYDGCRITDNILKNVNIIVNKNGEIFGL